MKLILAIITALSLSGCVTVSLDVPTKFGRATLSSNGDSVLLGFKK